MARKKVLCIDLRWIDASGVGMYIQGILPGIVGELEDVEIVGLGDRTRLQQFAWSTLPNVRLIQASAPRYSLQEQIELPHLIPRGCDLFFSPYYTIPLFYRGPLAVTVHDMSHMVVDEMVSNRKKRIYAQVMYRALARRASLVFTVSEFTRHELTRLTSTDPGKVVVTHLGVAPDWYQPQEQPIARPRPYLVVVGNIKPYKNLPRLLDAFLSLKDEVPHDLVLVGQGEGLITGESATFFERVHQAGPRVVLAGKVPYKQLLQLVAHAEALVMPSLYEGFGLPPIEAMAAGVPAAVANAASLPEVCGPGAVYFDPTDVADIRRTLLTLLTNPDLRRQIAQAGYRQSLQYRWQTTAALTAAHLRAALA